MHKAIYSITNNILSFRKVVYDKDRIISGCDSKVAEKTDCKLDDKQDKNNS